MLTRRIIFLAGSGRSGTTWIGNVLASCRGCASIFEPLQPKSPCPVPAWGRHSEMPGPYLAENDEHPAWAEYFREVFKGNVNNTWTRQDWARVSPAIARHAFLSGAAYRWARTCYAMRWARSHTCVVKEIRPNLLLPWLARQFPVEILYLFRHPCAVVGSRLRLGWTHELDDAYAQPALLDGPLVPFGEIMEGAKTPVEKMAILWCVENLLFAELAARRLCKVLYYEDFVAAPQEAFAGLVSALGLRPSRSTARAIREVVSTPSRRDNKPASWHSPLTREEGELVIETCEKFGLRIYGRRATPNERGGEDRRVQPSLPGFNGP